MNAVRADTAKDLSQAATRHRRMLESLVGIPATEGNSIEVLRNGNEIFPAMLDGIRAAQRSIDLVAAVYWKGEIAERFARALADAARRGVRVRVVVDGFGAAPMDAGLRDLMRSAGALVHEFRPMLTRKFWRITLRTHRRALVCDETEAFVGGVGIGSEWTGDARGPSEWRDTHVRVRGPAVEGIRGAFVNDWIETRRPLFDARDAFPEQERAGDVTVQTICSAAEIGWNTVAVALRTLIDAAERRIRITTAYFRPPQTFMDALCDASHRGVEVEVLVSGPHTDRRWVQLQAESKFQALLDAGVTIWRFQPSMVHAKVVTVDGVTSVVGTSNFDSRSMAMNEQDDLVLFDPRTTAILDAHFDDDLARSERLERESWRRRSSTQRYLECLMDVVGSGLRGAGAAR